MMLISKDNALVIISFIPVAEDPIRKGKCCIFLQCCLGHVIKIPIFNYEWTVNSKELTLTAKNCFAQMAPRCDTSQTAAE